MRLAILSALVACTIVACVSLDGFSGGTTIPDGGGGDSSSPIVGQDGAAISGQDASSSSSSSSGSPGLTAIAYIQGTSVYSGTSTAKLTLTKAVTAHDTLLLGLTVDMSANAKTVTDSLGNTFVRVAGAASIYDLRAYLYAAYDVKAGADIITVTAGGGDGPVDALSATVDEYAGIAPNGLDAASSNSGMAKGADQTTTLLTTTKANTLLYGYGYAANADADGTLTAGTGFTLRTSVDGQLTEERSLAAAGATTVSATMTTGNGWVFVGAAFFGP